MSAGRGHQRACIVCGTVKAAFPGVDYCFGCWPGGPVTPPPCVRCGSRQEYFLNGLCHHCHRDGHPGVASCRNCLAWGATRGLKYLCGACNSWCQTHTLAGPCAICGHHGVLDDDGVCRPCIRQAAMARASDRTLSLAEANRHGHQLVFADMIKRREGRAPQLARLLVAPYPLGLPSCRQLRLFEMPRDLSQRGNKTSGLAARADPALAAALEPFIRARASQYGWTKDATWRVRTGVQIMLGFIDGPGVALTASDAAVLAGAEHPVSRVLDVLADAGMVEQDRIQAVEAWFARQTSGLPEQMVAELRRWFDIMLHGSSVTPRRRPRSQISARLHLTWALPALRAWAEDGRCSLREVSAADIRAVLPPSGNPRSTLGAGLRSIFTVLRQQKVLFTNPIKSIRTGYHQPREPLPLDLSAVRDALSSPEPARAVVVALAGFHGLRAGQMRTLLLTDISDGRLRADGRVILLATPARVRLDAWLDYRTRHWPRTANPHLLVNQRSALGTGPVGHRWIKLATGMPGGVQAIREDRILHEAHASGGDIRLICDLFGLSVTAAERYTTTVSHPDLISKARADA
ncbi:MAG: hypothetical protein M0030_24485 [Actinomycetota bacterium]|nr:hypothetical protein [Actinomycetota bacterium]